MGPKLCEFHFTIQRSQHDAGNLGTSLQLIPVLQVHRSGQGPNSCDVLSIPRYWRFPMRCLIQTLFFAKVNKAGTNVTALSSHTCGDNERARCGVNCCGGGEGDIANFSKWHDDDRTTGKQERERDHPCMTSAQGGVG